jgi:CubicO group peptidase (beta-lactamase class C family)
MWVTAVLLLVAAQAAPPADVASRIQAVETGLLPPVVIKGRPVPKHAISERMKALTVRGVSVAVIKDYKIEWARGYGFADLESKRPVTTATLFQAGSISKPVAAAGAMVLVERGKLKLDENVNLFLKSWKVPDNDFTRDQKVTLRRLLSHTAGLTVHGFPGYAAATPVPTVAQILDGTKPANTAAIRVDLVPGTQYRYSGGGYTVAQLMITDATGQPFAAFMARAVLAKAGMKESTYENPLPPNLAALAATGYRRTGDPVPGRYYTYPEMAAAGLWTTASDLARFAIEIQKSREGRSNRILKMASVEQMLREQKQRYGLGFGLDDRLAVKTFGHGGADEGFQALLSATVDGRGLVVLTNSDNGSALAGEIARAVGAVYGWGPTPRERPAITLPGHQLGTFAGEYDGGRIGRVKISVEGDHLLVAVDGPGIVPLYPETADTFFSLTGSIPDLKFARDAGGKVISFTGGNVTAMRVR